MYTRLSLWQPFLLPPPNHLLQKEKSHKHQCTYATCFDVPETGLEPARCETHAPETCASTNSAIRASKAGANIAAFMIRNTPHREIIRLLF